MIRRQLLRALLLAALLIPAGANAQNPFGASGSAGGPLSPEAEVFLATLETIRDYALEIQGDSLLWERAIDGLIRELGDPYAAVLSRDEVREFEESSTGNYAGIGIQISELNEAVTITSVFRNTPAERAGLQVGDRIVGVDSDANDRWTTTDASNRIRGAPGTTVIVTVERSGITQPIAHEMRREQVHIPAVTYERVFGDIGYVLFDRVTRNSAAEVDSVLALVQEDGVRGMILDLRQNPGGYLDESLNVADLFLDRGSVLVTTRSRARGAAGEIREESARARMAPRVAGLPIVVLVDQFSASAAEIIAGALQDHDRALVIGDRTFGKGTVQSVIPLPEGRLIRLTSGEWYTPQGRSLNRPRDSEGRVIEPETMEEFSSVGGRPLLGGGGVYPDLRIEPDTLTALEQMLLAAAADASIPLATRIQEVAFEGALRVRDQDVLPTGLPTDLREALITSLQTGGIAESALTPEGLSYLAWRLDVVFFQRLEAIGRSLEVQSERDSVLATAIRFLRDAENQADLFTLAEAASVSGVQAAVLPN